MYVEMNSEVVKAIEGRVRLEWIEERTSLLQEIKRLTQLVAKHDRTVALISAQYDELGQLFELIAAQRANAKPCPGPVPEPVPTGIPEPASAAVDTSDELFIDKQAPSRRTRVRITSPPAASTPESPTTVVSKKRPLEPVTSSRPSDFPFTSISKKFQEKDNDPFLDKPVPVRSPPLLRSPPKQQRPLAPRRVSAPPAVTAKDRQVKCVEVIRNKEQRDCLPGYTCPECHGFYELLELQGFDFDRAAVVNPHIPSLTSHITHCTMLG